MPPASPVPGWASGEVCTANTATRRGSFSGRRRRAAHTHLYRTGPRPAQACGSLRVKRKTRRSDLRQPGVQRTGAAHRTERVGIQPAQRHDPGSGLLHPVAERGDADVPRRQHRAFGECRLHLRHRLRVLGESLATDHQLVGVEQVTQQRDRLPEHPGPLGKQFFGLLVAAAGEPQQVGDARWWTRSDGRGGARRAGSAAGAPRPAPPRR